MMYSSELDIETESETEPLRNQYYNEIQDTLPIREEHFEFPKNLDEFLRDIYSYYKHKGFFSYLLNSLYNYMTITCSSLMIIFLIFSFKWDDFSKCRLDDKLCKTFDNYVDYNSLISWSWTLLFLQIVPLSYLFFTKCKIAKKNYKIYNQISVDSNDLRTLNWSMMIRKLQKLQKNTHFIRSSMKINALNIVGRIMRIDNYKIALFTHEIIPLGSPNLYESVLGTNETWYLGKILEKNLDYIFFKNDIINSNTFELKLIDESNFNNRLKLFSVLNFLAIPFLILYTIIHSVFEYVNEMYSKNEGGLRYFTPHSIWMIREYNELEHQFYYRLSQSQKHTESYFKIFQNPVYTTISKGIVFILSCIIFMICIFGLLDDSVLIRVTLFNRGLVWYFALFSTLVAFLRPSAVYKTDNYINSTIQMKKISSFTHVCPDFWKNLDSWSVKQSFENISPNRLTLIFQEIVCILQTPYIMWYVLPRYTKKMLGFCKDITYHDQTIGAICKFSTLNIDKYGDNHLKELIRNSGTVDNNITEYDEIYSTNKLINYKIEKSYVKFKISYPFDVCGLHDIYGDSILDGIKQIHEDGGNFVLMTKSVMHYPGSTISEEHLGGANEEIFWAMEEYIEKLKNV